MTKGTLSARPMPEKAEAPEAEDKVAAPETEAKSAKSAKSKASSSPAPKPVPVRSPTAVKGANLQDVFLNFLRREKIPVTMFLVKGVKLQGIVTWFDNFSILLRRDGQSQLVYKHAISTIMPGQPVNSEQFAAGEASRKQRLLQDIFLTRVRDSEVAVTMFLVNGVMLQGRIAAFDLFCMLLEREGFVQLAYKHAVSTIQPDSHVDLTGDIDDGDA